jgi:hypothetical protein
MSCSLLSLYILVFYNNGGGTKTFHKLFETTKIYDHLKLDRKCNSKDIYHLHKKNFSSLEYYTGTKWIV